MKESIKKRIEAVRRGEVPEGYRFENGYLIPHEWVTVLLNSRFSRSTRKNRTGCENVLTISAQMGLVNQREFYDKDIASEDKSGYFLMKNGEFAYNKSYSTGYPYGAIKQLTRYDEGIVSPLYICFAPKADTNTAFYIQYFESGRYNREIYRVAQEGARNHGLLNIAVEDFFSGVLVEPSASEQQKIAEILATCDRVIELKRQLLEEKRRQKQWLMQKLLDPNSGVQLPEFENSIWKKVVVGEECDMFSGGTPKAGKEEYYADGTIPFIRSGEIASDVTELFLTDEGYDNSSAKIVCVGDLLYALYGANSGDCAISKIHGAINQAILCIKPKRMERSMLYYLLCANKERIISTYLQGGQGNLSAEIIKKLVVEIPTSNAHQKKIIDMLSVADKGIASCESELVAWQQMKKALLQLLLTGLVRVNA